MTSTAEGLWIWNMNPLCYLADVVPAVPRPVRMRAAPLDLDKPPSYPPITGGMTNKNNETGGPGAWPAKAEGTQESVQEW